MKFARFIALAALVAMSAVVVNAGSIKPDAKSGGDPKLTINKPGGGVIANKKGGSDPMATFVLQYEGNANLTNLFAYVPVPPNEWSASSNIFGQINSLFGTPPGFHFLDGLIVKGDIIDVTVAYTGAPPTGAIDITQGFVCISSCTVNGITVESNVVNPTPEPSTLLMFLSLGPAIGFAKKRWNARQSA
jgi:hypothetical protein